MWLLTDITEQSIRQCSVLSEFSCNASDEFTFRLKLIVSPPASNMFGKRPIVDKLSAGGSWMDWILCLQIQEFYFYLCSFSKALLLNTAIWVGELMQFEGLVQHHQLVNNRQASFSSCYIRVFVFVFVFLYIWFFYIFIFTTFKLHWKLSGVQVTK